jgi:hypothetical protein
VSPIIRRRPFLIAGVVVALLVVLVFGGQAAWRLGRRLMGPPPPPRQTDVALIADWMSVPYVSRAYRVPEPELYRALGVEPEEGRRRSPLREIARETGRGSDEVLTTVRETVSAWQEAHPGPPTPIGATPPPLPAPKTKGGGQDGPRPPP